MQQSDNNHDDDAKSDGSVEVQVGDQYDDLEDAVLVQVTVPPLERLVGRDDFLCSKTGKIMALPCTISSNPNKHYDLDTILATAEYKPSADGSRSVKIFKNPDTNAVLDQNVSVNFDQALQRTIQASLAKIDARAVQSLPDADKKRLSALKSGSRLYDIYAGLNINERYLANLKLGYVDLLNLANPKQSTIPRTLLMVNLNVFSGYGTSLCISGGMASAEGIVGLSLAAVPHIYVAYRIVKNGLPTTYSLDTLGRLFVTSGLAATCVATMPIPLRAVALVGLPVLAGIHYAFESRAIQRVTKPCMSRLWNNVSSLFHRPVQQVQPPSESTVLLTSGPMRRPSNSNN